MTDKSNNSSTPAADQPGRPPPVRVKLWRADAYVAQTHPPDGETKNWWRRLNNSPRNNVERFRKRHFAPNSGCVLVRLLEQFQKLALMPHSR